MREREGPAPQRLGRAGHPPLPRPEHEELPPVPGGPLPGPCRGVRQPLGLSLAVVPQQGRAVRTEALGELCAGQGRHLLLEPRSPGPHFGEGPAVQEWGPGNAAAAAAAVAAIIFRLKPGVQVLFQHFLARRERHPLPRGRASQVAGKPAEPRVGGVVRVEPGDRGGGLGPELGGAPGRLVDRLRRRELCQVRRLRRGGGSCPCSWAQRLTTTDPPASFFWS
mmetsp:Transcript_10142/g.23441  ORF Transcript_10142/g.23441 Transcript_10142/m.23441 type:complete len:222 (+) Transcript_10142:810-1475(+)